jgi:D-alanine-D-alanine ligase
MGLKGVVRSEFIIVDDLPHLLEINSVPGMTQRSIVPQQVEAMGMELSDFLDKLLFQAEK